jgi:transposase
VHSPSTRERFANPPVPAQVLQPAASPKRDPLPIAQVSALILSGDLALPADLSGAEAGRGKLGPYLSTLANMVEARPRSMIRDFHHFLREKGYSGSYDLVKKKVQSIRRGLGRQSGALFASADTPFAQVEFLRIPLKGSPGSKGHLFTMLLGHSGRCYAELVPGCELAAFLDCHRNAFAFFGGVPAGLFYNTRENPELRRLVGGFPFHLPIVDCGRHYGYASHPTPAFAPWMKGRLKRPGKILHKRFFPDYAFVSWERTNAEMRDWLIRSEEMGEPDSRAEKLRPLPETGFDPGERRQFLRLRSDSAVPALAGASARLGAAARGN